MTRAWRDAARVIAAPEAEPVVRLANGLDEAGLLGLVDMVAARHRVTTKDILSRSRVKSVVRARHACWWAIQRAHGKSSTEVGTLFGVDHTSVLQGVRVHQERLAEGVSHADA